MVDDNHNHDDDDDDGDGEIQNGGLLGVQNSNILKRFQWAQSTYLMLKVEQCLSFPFLKIFIY